MDQNAPIHHTDEQLSAAWCHYFGQPSDPVTQFKIQQAALQLAGCPSFYQEMIIAEGGEQLVALIPDTVLTVRYSCYAPLVSSFEIFASACPGPFLNHPVRLPQGPIHYVLGPANYDPILLVQ